jgi:hypothetical protein
MKPVVMQASMLSSAQRGAQWLTGLQQPDGSLRGAVSVGDYYKGPFALAVTGHNREAERMLDYVAQTFLKQDGDLEGRGLEWFETFRIYPHAWLTIGSMMRGRFEIAHSLLCTLVAYHDPKSGGFFATAEACKHARGQQEMMSTSLAGLACLWAGRLDIAERTGKWLENLFEAQPDLSRGLYHVWHSEKGLITEFPKKEATSYLVDARELQQWYFQYGISAAFLSSLSAATREKRWITLAQKFLRASRHCREDVYREPASGKIGWGAAWTYRLSQDPEDRNVAEAVAEGLRALQNEDGSWTGQSVYERESGTRAEPSIDVTSEFVGLLGCLELVLGKA